MSENVVLKASIDKYYLLSADGITAVEFVVKWGENKVAVFDSYCDAERYIDTKLYDWYLEFLGLVPQVFKGENA